MRHYHHRLASEKLQQIIQNNLFIVEVQGVGSCRKTETPGSVDSTGLSVTVASDPGSHNVSIPIPVVMYFAGSDSINFDVCHFTRFDNSPVSTTDLH